jgi:hypothetical protein
MTKTDFLRKLLELGNRAGAYSVGEARSGAEIIDSIESSLRKLEELLQPENKTPEKADAL